MREKQRGVIVIDAEFENGDWKALAEFEEKLKKFATKLEKESPYSVHSDSLVKERRGIKHPDLKNGKFRTS